MQNFLFAILQNQGIVAGIICNVLLFYNFKKLKQQEKIILLIVFYTVVFEIIALWLGNHHQNNQWLYNVLSFPDFIIYSSFFYSLSESKKRKKFILYFSTILFLAHTINMSFFQGFQTLNTYTNIPINIFTAVMAYQYMKQCVEQYDENPFKNFIFWFSMATLIEFAGVIPVVATLSWLAYIATDVVDKFYFIATFLFTLWFALISIGLLWTKRLMKLQSLSS